MGFFWVLSMRYCGMEWLIMQFVILYCCMFILLYN